MPIPKERPIKPFGLPTVDLPREPLVSFFPPRASQPLRFRDLGWLHLGSDDVPALDRLISNLGYFSAGDRQVVPLVSLHIILCHARTVFVHIPKGVLRSRDPLVCNLAVQTDRNGIVPRYAPSFIIHDAEVVL